MLLSFVIVKEKAAEAGARTRSRVNKCRHPPPCLAAAGQRREREGPVLLYRTKNGDDGQTATRVAPWREGGGEAREREA